MIQKLITEKLASESYQKLNVLSFFLEEIPVSAKTIIYERSNAPSSFHNAKDIPTGGFYKWVSLMIDEDFYEKI